MSERMTDPRVELLTQTTLVAKTAMVACAGWVAVSVAADPGNHCCVFVGAVWDQGEAGERVRWHGPLCTEGAPRGALAEDIGRQLARELHKARSRARMVR